MNLYYFIENEFISIANFQSTLNHEKSKYDFKFTFWPGNVCVIDLLQRDECKRKT